MERLKSDELIKVVDNLIGVTMPYGDTNIDKERLKNTQLLIDLVEYLTEEMRFLQKFADRPEYSINKIGKPVKEHLRFLYDDLKEIFEENTKNKLQ